MRGSSVDCEVDLTAAACVNEFPKLDLSALRFSLALLGKLVGEDKGDEIFLESQRRDVICFVLCEVYIFAA